MQKIRAEVKHQDRFRCKICSKSGDGTELHVHHIIPLDKYGSNHPNNLITLCHSCHNKQHPGFQVTRNIALRRERTGGEFVALDIETTGLSSKKDHIIELAAIKFKAAKPVEEFCTLIRPVISIPNNITSLTGITDSMVASAPYIDEIFNKFIYFIGDYKLVAHNSAFDMIFLNRYAQELGYKINNEVIDTLHLSRKKVPYLNNHKLQTLVRHFNITTNGKHRALADSHATAQVYIECLRTTKKKQKANKKIILDNVKNIDRAQKTLFQLEKGSLDRDTPCFEKQIIVKNTLSVDVANFSITEQPKTILKQEVPIPKQSPITPDERTAYNRRLSDLMAEFKSHNKFSLGGWKDYARKNITRLEPIPDDTRSWLE